VLIGRIGRVINPSGRFSANLLPVGFPRQELPYTPLALLPLITGVCSAILPLQWEYFAKYPASWGRILIHSPTQGRIHKRARKKSVASQQFRLHWWQHWQLFWRTILASQRRKRSERTSQESQRDQIFLVFQVSLFCWAVSYFSINCGSSVWMFPVTSTLELCSFMVASFFLFQLGGILVFVAFGLMP